MNCLLHGMEGDDEGVVHLGNALGEAGKSLPRADVVLANLPFDTAKVGEKLAQSILAKAFRGELTAEWHAENPELISGEHSARRCLIGSRRKRPGSSRG